MQQLALSARPRSLDALIGQEKLVAHIRGLMKSDRVINNWLIVGPTGTGKTTTARIIANSLQCTHQAIFGRPCKECRMGRADHDTYPINGSKITGKEALEAELSGADSYPRMSPYRVYIIDECHRISESGQSLVLQILEDSPETTIFILATTDPHKLNETIQSRCSAGTLRLRPLDMDGVTTLVTRLLEKAQSDRPVDRLVDALVEAHIRYPRSICGAVEKYIAGSDPLEAVDVQGGVEVDTKALTRALVKGDWPGVTRYLQEAQNSDSRGIRLSVIAYLRAILLQSPEIGERTKIVAEAVSMLCNLQNTEGMVMLAGVSAALYHVTALFSEYKR